jgi:hypothetical protein
MGATFAHPRRGQRLKYTAAREPSAPASSIGPTEMEFASATALALVFLAVACGERTAPGPSRPVGRW